MGWDATVTEDDSSSPGPRAVVWVENLKAGMGKWAPQSSDFLPMAPDCSYFHTFDT